MLELGQWVQIDKSPTFSLFITLSFDISCEI